MRLARLDLLAFGHFTDVRLNFNHGLQIVYGPNEAGKTTALRAIRQLLFGFDEQTPDDFVHKYANLRIGAAILDSAGNKIEVVRRKARKDSLKTADESSTIDENLWQQLLCGIDEPTFSKRYGIDYEQLAKGGHEIATGTGDLGEILFAAGSGISDLTLVRKQLNDEAGKLFKPTGKNQKLIIAITEWQKNRTLSKEKLLLASEWEEIDRRKRDAIGRLEDQKRALAERTRELELSRRYQRAIPLLHERELLNQELKLLVNVKRLPADFAARKYEALTRWKQAEEQQSAAEETLAILRANPQPPAVSNRLLERADELTRLIADWGSYHKAQTDRHHLLTQLETLSTDIHALLRTLGIDLDTNPLLPPAFDRSKRSRLGQLGRKQLSLAADIARHQNRCATLQQQQTKCEQDLSDLPAIESVDKLRDWVRRARGDGDLETRLTRVRREADALEEQIRQQFDQLSMKPATLEQLETMRCPTSSEIREWEDRFAENQRDRAVLDTRLRELEAEISQARDQITGVKREFAIATLEELEQARIARDAAWKAIREALKSGTMPTRSQLDQFEQRLIEADQIADRLRSQASHVAQFAEIDDQRKANESRLHEASTRLAEVESKRNKLDQSWKTLWPDLPGPPQSPRDMQTWLAKREDILQLQERRLGYDADLKDLRSQIDRFSAQFTQIVDVRSIDEPPRTLSEMMAFADRRIEFNEAAGQARRNAEETRLRLAKDLAESTEQFNQATKELDQSRTEWQSTLKELGLSPELSPEKIDSYLETINEFTEKHAQVEGLRQRLKGIDADAAVFEAGTRKLCAELAPELSNQKTDTIVGTLRDGLLASQKAQSILNEQSAKQRQAEQQLTRSTETRKQVEELVNGLYGDAGLGRPVAEGLADRQTKVSLFEQLTLVEQKSNKKDSLGSKWDRIEKDLEELSAETCREDFVEHALKQSPEELATRIQQLDAECRRMAEERERGLTELGEFNLQLKEMDGGSEAAKLEEDQRQLVARIRSDVEQYARIKLASFVLRTSIERYRERIRGPILSVASDLFRELTLDSFAGLRIDEDDAGNPILVGLRNGSRDPISVAGMSEGTCDQLYLALRLASLSLETEPRDSLPFIVDDILVQFDDARSAAALRALSRLGKKRQIIFFTHHKHLLELASQHLPGEFDTLRLDA